MRLLFLLPRVSDTPSQRELFTLFLPLALGSLFYPLASPVVNAALARTADPELALAIYAVARGLSNPLISPLHGMRQVVTALVHDQALWRPPALLVAGFRRRRQYRSATDSQLAATLRLDRRGVDGYSHRYRHH